MPKGETVIQSFAQNCRCSLTELSSLPTSLHKRQFFAPQRVSADWAPNRLFFLPAFIADKVRAIPGNIRGF